MLKYLNKNIKYVFVHHSGGLASNPNASTQHFTWKQIDNAHKARWNFKSSLGHYAGYTAIIEADGTLKQTRAVGEETAAVSNYNLNSISICLTGNFNGIDKPTKEQERTLEKLLAWCYDKFDMKTYNFLPHRAKGNTWCYGSSLSDKWIQDKLSRGITLMFADLRGVINTFISYIVNNLRKDEIGLYDNRECLGYIKVGEN